ncbi:hypothetical protein Goari_004587 [Gossypium aridum]|uniref:DUF4283 domain-containing protein n=1 Tax=Gossypium aridum TaxID=34290 RepID=A0A7J8Y3V8_GOSAI|nr:hypothetical protein [Gossypium aridum]
MVGLVGSFEIGTKWFIFTEKQSLCPDEQPTSSQHQFIVSHVATSNGLRSSHDILFWRRHDVEEMNHNVGPEFLKLYNLVLLHAQRWRMHWMYCPLMIKKMKFKKHKGAIQLTKKNLISVWLDAFLASVIHFPAMRSMLANLWHPFKEDPLKVPLIYVCFWVQMHDIPPRFFSKVLARQLGHFIGHSVEYGGESIARGESANQYGNYKTFDSMLGLNLIGDPSLVSKETSQKHDSNDVVLEGEEGKKCPQQTLGENHTMLAKGGVEKITEQGS